MSNTTDVQVMIGGKPLTLSGMESEEYLQKVASYINSKLAECMKSNSYTRQSQDMQTILLALNIADDYFKAKQQITDLGEQIETKEKELYNIKHELIASQIRLENTEKKARTLEMQINESSKKIIRLETEIKNQGAL